LHIGNQVRDRCLYIKQRSLPAGKKGEFTLSTAISPAGQHHKVQTHFINMQNEDLLVFQTNLKLPSFHYQFDEISVNGKLYFDQLYRSNILTSYEFKMSFTASAIHQDPTVNIVHSKFWWMSGHLRDIATNNSHCFVRDFELIHVTIHQRIFSELVITLRYAGYTLQNDSEFWKLEEIHAIVFARFDLDEQAPDAVYRKQRF
jgi:hypothetical protein